MPGSGYSCVMSSGKEFSPQRMALLSFMLADPTQQWFALGLAEAVGVRSSTVYDAVKAWTEKGWIEFGWEEIDPEVEGRPRRKLYRFSTDGAALARAALDKHQQLLERAVHGQFQPNRPRLA